MRGWNYVELERYCESLKEERDKYRQEAMQERELTEDIVGERETLIIENEWLKKYGGFLRSVIRCGERLPDDYDLDTFKAKFVKEE